MRLKSICIAVAVFIVSTVVADAQLVGQIVYSSKVWVTLHGSFTS